MRDGHVTLENYSVQCIFRKEGVLAVRCSSSIAWRGVAWRGVTFGAWGGVGSHADPIRRKEDMAKRRKTHPHRQWQCEGEDGARLVARADPGPDMDGDGDVPTSGCLDSRAAASISTLRRLWPAEPNST